MFSSFELHSVSTVLSAWILYSADFSTPLYSMVDEVELTAEVELAAVAAAFAASGLGTGLMPPCSETVTEVVTVGIAVVADVALAVAALVRLAMLPPNAAA